MNYFLYLFFNYLLVGVVYSAIIYYLLLGERKFALRILLALILAWTVSYLIKSIFYFPRPYLALGLEPLYSHPSDGSFPSAHTATTFAVAFTVFRRHKKLGFNLLVLSGLVAAARVVYDYHFWIDIAGGLLLAKLIDSWQSS